MLIGTMLLAGCGTVQRMPEEEAATQNENDVYIPENLEDCFVQLKKLLKPEDIERMKAGSEDDMIQYHFGLGMGMRNAWGLWGGSRLAKWFNAQGITHPDDMSCIILDSFWRHLNEKPINLEQQIKYYQDYWKKQKEAQRVGADFVQRLAGRLAPANQSLDRLACRPQANLRPSRRRSAPTSWVQDMKLKNTIRSLAVLGVSISCRRRPKGRT